MLPPDFFHCGSKVTWLSLQPFQSGHDKLLVFLFQVVVEERILNEYLPLRKGLGHIIDKIQDDILFNAHRFDSMVKSSFSGNCR